MSAKCSPSGGRGGAGDANFVGSAAHFSSTCSGLMPACATATGCRKRSPRAGRAEGCGGRGCTSGTCCSCKWDVPESDTRDAKNLRTVRMLPRPPGCRLLQVETCAFSARGPTLPPSASENASGAQLSARTFSQRSPQALSASTASQSPGRSACRTRTTRWSRTSPWRRSVTHRRLQAAWNMWLHLYSRNHCTRRAQTSG
mmetsp:Transcript_96793/g.246147  ORF Transcript_96793/g.246147 Transcript_96793/m.246147 type:complete len:200 (-) Transcript_96793:64-663(-)